MDLEKIVRAAKDQGWEVGRTEKSHWSFTNPEGATFITSGTPSDVRSVRNALAGLVRLGLEWPPPSKKQLRSRRNKGEGSK